MIIQSNSSDSPDDGMAGPALSLVWQTGRYRLRLDRVHLMGIVNVTPDSFSDGGQFLSPRAALAQCERLVAEGADLLDLGAESTRLNATPVAAEEEWRRLQPVLREALELGVPVSVDTHKPEVMRAALEAGADLINDVRALTTPGALQALAAHPTAGVCLMHSRGDPSTMQTLAHYGDVVEDVATFLAERYQAACAAGIATECIALDPGYGFAKTMEHSVELLARQSELLSRLADAGVHRPLLAGLSRKGTVGRLTGRPVEQRLAGSLAAALLAAQRGARILRVHDVAQTLDVLKVWQAVEQASHETIAIGLGANLGDARATLAWALQQLQAHPRVTLRQVSSLYRTRPVEAEGPDYLNAVALLHTSLEPEALLQLLQDLELQAGRERPYRNAPRTLDLDLLLYGQRVLNSATLTLPHPRMHQRRFVLEPLAEVAPALAIPHAGPLGTLLTQVAAQVVERCDGPEEWLSALARNRPTTSVG
jgi:dihydropteroate synthase